MHYWSSLLGGIGDLGSFAVVGVLIVGTLAGLFVGAIPGLGGIVVMVLMLPFLYHMNPIIGLALLLGAHSAIYYAGSTTAILINTPGAPESAATCFDGYAMTRKGRTGEALGISAFSTTLGGWLGALGLVICIPFMAPLITLFHPPAYFFLAVLAVVIIGQLQSKSVTKGLLSGLFGFLLAFFGAAPSTGSLRFTFGNLGLYSGINIATAAIGLFAISEMFVLFARNRRIAEGGKVRLSRELWSEVGVGIRDVPRHKWLTIRSAILGFICGVIPGIGSTAANFLSYGQAVQTSKHQELFGTGIPEGIIAPEASSISKEAGALIPTVALGVPTGPGMAIVLAAFAILGLAPGQSMLQQHLDLVFLMVFVIAIAALLASAIGLGLAPVLARITTVPSRILVPFVLTLAAIGAFASTTLLMQVLVMMMMGVAGLVLRRFGYSLPAIIVGIVLGKVAENNLILTSQLYGIRTFENFLPDLLLALIIAVIVFGGRSRRRKAREERAAALEEGATVAARNRTWGELVLDCCWVAGAAGYVYMARSYPSPAELAPTYLGAAVLAVGLVQLIGGFVPFVSRFTLGGAGLAPSRGTRGPERSVVAVAAPPGPGGDEKRVPAPAVLAAVPVTLAGTIAQRGLPGSPSEVGLAVGQAEPSSEAADARLGEALEKTAMSREQEERQPGVAVNQFACVALAFALVGGIYLFGYKIAIPAFTLLYFLFVYRWTWWKGLVAAAVMAGAAYAAATFLNAIFPGGVLL